MEKQKLIDLILSPFMNDSIRYLVAIECEVDDADGFFSEPLNASQLHFVLAVVNQFSLYEGAFKIAATKSERWKFLFENYTRYCHVFSQWNQSERTRAECEYLELPASNFHPQRLTA